MPILRPALKHLFLYLFTVIPLTSAAQTISDTNINTAFAPVTVLEGHPACNQPGDTAFSVAMRTEDLHFRLTGPNWYGSVDVKPMETPDSTTNCSFPERRGADINKSNCTNTYIPVSEEKQCYILVRKGSKVVEREVHCEPNDSRRDLIDLAAAEDLRLGVEAEVTICQSVTSYRILEGRWSAAIAVDNKIAAYDGQLILPSSLDCYETDQPFTQRAGVTYSPGQTPADFDGKVDWNYPTFVRLWIDNLAVPLPGTEESPVALETAAAFFPTVNGKPICPSGNCAVANRYTFDVGSTGWSACRR
ncbi:MAG: hypothetical protein ABJH45_10610 [Paracoccaceae bacterium]